MNDQILVIAEYDTDRGDGVNVRVQQAITLPAWCSGDPAVAVALYLFGYADAVATLDIRVLTVA
jgi:hypothetical protein